MNEIHAITFDGDGTLWDFNAAMTSALRDAAALLTDEGLRYKGRSVSLDFLKDVREEVAAWPMYAGAQMETIRYASFMEAMTRCGVQAPDLVQRVYDRYMHTRLMRTELFPDARPVLQQLQGRYKLAVVTNGNTHPLSMSIAPLLDDIVIAAEVGYSKPDPAIYRLTVQRLGVSAAHALHVGDHPMDDVQAAQHAGMSAVWLDRRPGPCLPTRAAGMDVIGNLDELPRFLEQRGLAVKDRRGGIR